MPTIDDLINYADASQPTKFGETLDTILAQKAADSLEQMRDSIAQNLFGQEDIEDDDIDDEDDSDENEDDDDVDFDEEDFDVDFEDEDFELNDEDLEGTEDDDEDA
jgi:ribonuclease E